MTIRIIGSMLAVLALVWGCYAAAEHFRDQGRAELQARWDAETRQRIAAENSAILTRIKNNERLAEQQAIDKQKLKAGYEKEIADVRAVAAIAGRLRISQGVCAGFASAAQTDGSTGGAATATGTRTLPEPYARDIGALMLEADEIVASCRVAQEYLKKTGQLP
ncbi:hypothetical protein [Undibacterium curvum]|uniref:hypothetical protein n=1 Tax=Undibacterium curvum TaxID=2762294 RepID=UPI003D11B0E3